MLDPANPADNIGELLSKTPGRNYAALKDAVESAAGFVFSSDSASGRGSGLRGSLVRA